MTVSLGSIFRQIILIRNFGLYPKPTTSQGIWDSGLKTRKFSKITQNLMSRNRGVFTFIVEESGSAGFIHHQVGSLNLSLDLMRQSLNSTSLPSMRMSSLPHCLFFMVPPFSLFLGTAWNTGILL